MPKIAIELVDSTTDMPLGVSEATAGPMAASIGNAVSHALGTRIRELPLTRERIMATMLALPSVANSDASCPALCTTT